MAQSVESMLGMPLASRLAAPEQRCRRKQTASSPGVFLGVAALVHIDVGDPSTRVGSPGSGACVTTIKLRDQRSVFLGGNGPRTHRWGCSRLSTDCLPGSSCAPATLKTAGGSHNATGNGGCLKKSMLVCQLTQQLAASSRACVLTQLRG
jgi:hypothetical protein